jgi:hypothetical protein
MHNIKLLQFGAQGLNHIHLLDIEGEGTMLFQTTVTVFTSQYSIELQKTA